MSLWILWIKCGKPSFYCGFRVEKIHIRAFVTTVNVTAVTIHNKLPLK